MHKKILLAGRQRLRSATSSKVNVPHTWTKIGSRVLSVSGSARARPGLRKIFASDSPNEYFLRQNDDLFATIIYLCVHILLTYIISTDFPIASFIVFVQYLHDTRYTPFVQFAYYKL